MIEVNFSGSEHVLQKEINMNRAMLITGPGSSYKHQGKIMYFDSLEAVQREYGASKLTDAFALAKKLGVEFVFLANIQAPADYIDFAPRLSHYDFAYVVPVGLLLGDSFHDGANRRKKSHYIGYLLEEAYLQTRTVFVITEKAASLYEEPDDFLDEMIKVSEEVKEAIGGRSDRSSLIFCLNNLEDHDLANVVIASALCSDNLEEYPGTSENSRSIFDLDEQDVRNTEMVLLRKNSIGQQAIENLVNFLSIGDPRKPVAVDRISRFVQRNINLSRFKGNSMSAYMKLRIEEAIIGQLETLLDGPLRSFEVKSVRFEKEAAGVVVALCDIDIWPANSTEKMRIIVGGEAS